MGSELIELLVRVNIALAAGIALVLALRAPARKLFGARAAYALWLLPLAAAAMCFVPGRLQHVVVDPSIANFAPAASVAAEPPYLLWAWGAGALLSLIVLAMRQARFTMALGRLHAREELGARVRGAESAAHGPAVIGVIRPIIVTPSDFDARFDAEEQRIVLAHERAHLAQGDPWINAGVVFIQCVNWFNPFVHLAARALRIDQELACDAAVLSQTEGLRRRYAETILKTHIAQAAPIGCAWPPSSVNDIKERIAMLKRNLPSRAQRLAGASVVVLTAAGVAAAAWAAQPTRVVATFAAPLATDAALTEEGQALAGGEEREHRRHRGHNHEHRELTPEERAELEAALERMHEELGRMHEELGIAAQARHGAMASIDHEAISAAVAEAMEASRGAREAAMAEGLAEAARIQAEVVNSPAFQEEMRQAMREAEIELQHEMPRIQEETRIAMREALAEAERTLVLEAPRIREEMRIALREAEQEIAQERDRARARGDIEDVRDLDRALRELQEQRQRNERSERN